MPDAPTLLAVDPGPLASGWVAVRDSRLLACGQASNAELLVAVRRRAWPGAAAEAAADALVLEDVRSYGAPVGRDVFDTCITIGRFVQAWGDGACWLVSRTDVKLLLCGTARARDAGVRAALLDRFGGSRGSAVGTRAKPGPLHGIRGHCWAALALAVAFAAGVRARAPASEREDARCS